MQVYATDHLESVDYAASLRDVLKADIEKATRIRDLANEIIVRNLSENGSLFHGNIREFTESEETIGVFGEAIEILEKHQTVGALKDWCFDQFIRHHTLVSGGRTTHQMAAIADIARMARRGYPWR